jgi:methylmalonyl-CoA mutase C-terminal domain/subunit
VDVIALSILSGAHMSICRKVMGEIKEFNIEDKVVIVGGTITTDDIPKLKEMGIAEVFPPGSPINAGVDYLESFFKIK